jgi:hypothetical protein
MSKGLKTAVFIVLVTLGTGLLSKSLASSTSDSIPSAAKSTQSLVTQPLEIVDLVEFYDRDPSFDAPGCWQAVPRGLQTLANVPFQIGGLIQLWGEGPSGIGRNYRETVEGIPVKGKFQTIYVLHGSSFTTVTGTPIAGLVFRYADGSSWTNLIRYGTDSRDWWEPLAENLPLPTNSASKVIWRGDHPSLPDWARALRLFGSTIMNPKPDSEVRNVDLVSTKSRVTWVVLAMTTGPAGALKIDPQLEKENAPAEQVTIKVTGLDAATQKPIQDMRFRVTLLTGRRPKLYGVFSADEHGEAVIDLPPQHIRLLSIEASCSNHTSELMSWNVEKGEPIPPNYIFKASRESP